MQVPTNSCRRRLKAAGRQALNVCRSITARLTRHLAQYWAYFRSAVLPPRRALGQGLVEYGLILVLIAIVVIGALTILGNKTSNVYEEIACKMDSDNRWIAEGGAHGGKCKWDKK